MKLKIKRFKKLIITHQLEALLTLFSLLIIIISIAAKTWFLIPIAIIVSLLIIFAPQLLNIGKSYYEKLDLKFLNKNKKSNQNKKKAVNKNKKNVMAAMKKSEKKEDVSMVKKKSSKKSGARKPGGFKKFIKIFVLFMLICCILGFIAVALFMAYVVANAPKFDPQNLYKSESTIIYDKNGDQIAKIGTESREKITYEEVADVLIDAIIATEDSRYFQHNGFDLPRFVKAAFGQVLGNSSAGGASTLTMQIAKNAYTSTEDEGFEGIVRKFTDIYLAIFKIEKKYSKQEILEFYVNSYYLGGSAYGVEQASLNYFGKHAKDLNLSEAALIAGLFQSPGAYDPFSNPERATARRNIVLKLMVRHGYITQEQADIASSIAVEDMIIKKGSFSNNKYQGFIDTVVQEIKDDLGKNPYMVAMEIYTTMDPRVQDVVNNAMSGATFAWENPVVDAGVTVMDPQTGAIVGIGTGRDTSQEGLFNNATQIKRQIGSTSKPLYDYAPSIEYNNTSTYTLLGDEEYQYSDGTPISNYDGGYKGLVTAREAVVDSRNVPALKTFQKINKKNLLEMVKGLHLSPELDSTGTFIHEAHAIGGYNGESPTSLGAAYNTFGNGGYYIEPYSYTKIIFRDTNEEYEQKPEKNRVMSEETAYMVYSMLESTAKLGGMRNFTNNIIGKSFGAKTGTSNFTKEVKEKFHLASDAINDLWLVGVTDEYTISLWYGYEKISSDYYTRFGSVQSLYLFSALAKDIYTRDCQLKQPEGVVSVTVERNTIEPMLPSAYTPDELKITELFKKGTEPTTVSPRFERLNNVTNLKSSASGSSVTLMWDAVKTPELADDKYLQKYYGQVFTKPNWISSAVSSHLAQTGALGYDIYEKNENGSYSLIGSTTSSSYTFDAEERGEHTYVVRTAYGHYKANQSAGVSTNVRTTSGSSDVTGDVTLIFGKLVFTANTKLTIEDLGTPTVRYRYQDISDEAIVTFYGEPNTSKGTRSIKFKVQYNGKTYTATATLTFT
jgi:penicillin-binding protein 1A